MKKKFAIAATLIASGLSSAEAPSAKNVIVYKVAGRYAGWPANHGIWSWGNEILVGFESGHFKVNNSIHAVNYREKEEHLLARSLDGGETWTIEKPLSLLPPPGGRMAGVPTEDGGKAVVDNMQAIDFSHPNFAMTVRMMDKDTGPSRFYYSYDRGKTWQGPYRVPDFGTKGVAARTDYLIDGKSALTMFVTTALDTAKEGRVVCLRTTDGGMSWKQLGTVSSPQAGFSIMPSSIRLSKNTILTSVRRQESKDNFIELARSDDNGATWRTVSRITAQITGNSGNPPSMVRLKDGRLCVTYGHRAAPFGVRARFSSDEGATWGEEIVLRADGGDRDLGYPRTVIRPDGKLVTVYYFTDSPTTERYIAATIWDAPRS